MSSSDLQAELDEIIKDFDEISKCLNTMKQKGATEAKEYSDLLATKNYMKERSVQIKKELLALKKAENASSLISSKMMGILNKYTNRSVRGDASAHTSIPVAPAPVAHVSAQNTSKNASKQQQNSGGGAPAPVSAHVSAHASAQNTSKQQQQQKVCIYYTQGTCKYGNNCHNLHQVQTAQPSGGGGKSKTKGCPVEEWRANLETTAKVVYQGLLTYLENKKEKNGGQIKYPETIGDLYAINTCKKVNVCVNPTGCPKGFLCPCSHQNTP